MQSAFSFHPYMGDPLPMYVTISDTILLGWESVTMLKSLNLFSRLFKAILGHCALWKVGVLLLDLHCN